MWVAALPCPCGVCIVACICACVCICAYIHACVCFYAGVCICTYLYLYCSGTADMCVPCLANAVTHAAVKLTHIAQAHPKTSGILLCELDYC